MTEKEPSSKGGNESPIESYRARLSAKIEWVRAVGYEIFIDPALKEVRSLISDFIPENSDVIDIGCGSGALALHLSKSKGCSVLGVDLAHSKIQRANRKAIAGFSKVHFVEADATHLKDIPELKFDCATLSLFLHALPENLRRQVLKEAARVAKRIIIADYNPNQPKNFSGLAVKGIERIAGGEHFSNFNQYRASAGFDHLLKGVGLGVTEERLDASRTIRVAVVERKKL